MLITTRASSTFLSGGFRYRNIKAPPAPVCRCIRQIPRDDAYGDADIHAHNRMQLVIGFSEPLDMTEREEVA